MVFQITEYNNSNIDEQTYGKLIYQLNILATPNVYYKVETSVIIDCASFLSYKQAHIIPDELIEGILKQLNERQIIEADFFLSFYKDCLIELNPITVRITNTNVRNAITAIFERWFDGKPYARRKIQHLNDQDTYPAILIQPHRTQELSMITRHPCTGQLMHGGDGIGLVHCSKPVLDEIEENAIALIDRLLNQPCKIIYTRDADNRSITIRRVEPYPMTADARILYVLSKHDYDEEHTEDLLYLIQPEDIASVCGTKYTLTSNMQFSGMDASMSYATIGKAVFPWTNPETITDSYSYILLSAEFTAEDIRLLKKCRGAIFAYGGITSHGPSICRGLGIKCITGSSELLIDSNSKRASVIINNHNVGTPTYQEIKEGDRICIAGNKWSLNGEIIIDDRYIPASSREVRQKLGSMLKPYTNENVLKKITVAKQIHIAKLIKTMKEVGWKV